MGGVNSGTDEHEKLVPLLPPIRSTGSLRIAAPGAGRRIPGADTRRERSSPGMAAAERTAEVSRLERSSHTAFIAGGTLYAWGGYQVAGREDVLLPTDEIWLCDLDSGSWERREISGDAPPAGFCGSHVNGALYVLAGCEPVGYANEMFSVDLSEQRSKSYSWNKVTDTKGATPSPRNKHSCWVHRDRLIFFGGYGCKTVAEVRNTSTSNFVVEEMSWTVGNALFQCWGWNNEVCVFDTHTATWSSPETQGPAPAPRGCHASALLGNKGYVSGGVEKAELDMFCLDLETWTWTRFDLSPSCAPLGRSMFTMTPTSDHALFVYGGLGTDGNTLNDAWQFNTQKTEWNKMANPHEDKPRVCHTACLGRDDDVVVFGGSSNMRFLMDSVTILRVPSQNHCRDVFVFQTQPYALFRLCEDLIGRNPERFGKHLSSLPSKVHNNINKRVAFFSDTKPVLSA